MNNNFKALLKLGVSFKRFKVTIRQNSVKHFVWTVSMGNLSDEMLMRQENANFVVFNRENLFFSVNYVIDSQLHKITRRKQVDFDHSFSFTLL